MNPEHVVAAILSLFPYMSGNNRACVEHRRSEIAAQLTETADAGVPSEIMAAVAFVETHLGCDRGEGGGWGAPINGQHRHTAGTHMHAARVLIRGLERCGDWDGSIRRFRTGLCHPTTVGTSYLRRVNRLIRRIELRAAGQ